MDKLRVADALTEIFTVYKRCNKYIDETMPWALAKDEEKLPRLKTVLYNLVESICIATTLLKPFLPDTADKIFAQLGTEIREYDDLDKFGLYPNGGKVTDKPEILYARIDQKEMDAKIEAVMAKYAPKEEESEDDYEELPKIDFDDFAKVEMKVVVVKDCEKVKKAKKLLKFTLNDGHGERTIVSGIAKWYQPEELVGKHLVAVTNLKPRTLCGIESNGMLLSAEIDEENIKLIMVDESIPAGARLS